MLRRSPFRAFVISGGLLLSLPNNLDAADLSTLAAARGKIILQKNCGRCHAVEAVGESPLKAAPPMRGIYTRFYLRDLEFRLREGIGSAHREMPQIQFSDDDVYAILSYLYVLSSRRR